MNRVVRVPFAVVALAMAVLIPLETGYCMHMVKGRAAQAAHACCHGGADRASSPIPDDCPCFHDAPATVTAPVLAPNPLHHSDAGVVADAIVSIDAAVVAPRAFTEDSPGLAPPGPELEAHRLRGPPALA